MLLILAGMRRSGSTLSYQIGSSIVGNSTRTIDRLPDNAISSNDWYAIKSHAFHKDLLPDIKKGLVKVVTTVRDPRDCVVSIMSYKKNATYDIALNMVASGTRIQTMWEKKLTEISAYLAIEKYEVFVHDIEVLVRDIADVCDISIGNEKVKELIQRYSIENNRELSQKIQGVLNDFMSPNHIIDGEVGKWRRLGDDQILNIEQEVGKEWFRKHGYKLWKD